MKAKESSPSTLPARHTNIDVQKEQNYLVDIVIVRVIVALPLTIAAYVIEPFRMSGSSTVGLGLISALCIIYFEHRLKRATLKRLIGAAIGSILGIVGAVLISHVLTTTDFDTNSLSFIKLFILFLMTSACRSQTSAITLISPRLEGWSGSSGLRKRHTRSSTRASSSTDASPTSATPDFSTASS